MAHLRVVYNKVATKNILIRLTDLPGMSVLLELQEYYRYHENMQTIIQYI